MKKIYSMIENFFLSANQYSSISAENESENLGLPVGYGDYSPYL